MAQTTQSQSSSMLLALAAMSCREGAPKLTAEEHGTHMATLTGWQFNNDRIEKTFSFANYYETMAFVNALAWISHREDHHPDLAVHYNRCAVAYSTHSAGGVTINDVICAAKAERLYA